MAKIVKKDKTKPKKKKLNPSVEHAAEKIIQDFMPKPHPEGADKAYRMNLQEHLIWAIKKVLQEHEPEILKMAHDRILAMRTFNQHK